MDGLSNKQCIIVRSSDVNTVPRYYKIFRCYVAAQSSEAKIFAADTDYQAATVVV